MDGSGNVFVADTFNSAVKKIPPACVTSSCVITLGSGFYLPYGVAVDGTGNVFVGDTYNHEVKEILAADGNIPASPTINTLGSGFSYPYGVAVDASGNVFVADDSDTGEVYEIPAAGGYTTVLTLGGSVYQPKGLAVDGSGNVFVADSGHSRVLMLDYADAPSLNFGSISFGANSTATVTVQNIGNAPLTLPNPAAGSNPSISQYVTLDNSAATACPVVTSSSPAASLASGAYCTLAIGLDPTVLEAVS